MNLALPLVLFTTVLMLGEPKLANVIHTVYPRSMAEQLGLQIGDRLVAVDGAPVDVWDDLQRLLEERVGHTVELTVVRDGEQRMVELPDKAVRLAREGSLDFFALGFSPLSRSTLVGVVDPGSPAGRAGLQSGDLIANIDGVDVATWEDLENALVSTSQHHVVRVRIEDGQPVRTELALDPDPSWTRPEWATSADPWGLEYPAVVIGAVSPNSAAMKAGVRTGDRIVSIDGTPVQGWDEVLMLVAKTAQPDQAPRALDLDLVRDGKTVSLNFQPTWDQSIGRGGVVSYRPLLGISQYQNLQLSLDEVKKRYSFLEASSRSAALTSEAFQTLVRMVWNMVSYQVKVTDALGGPVAIVREAGEAAQSGIFSYVRTMAFISLSLGVVNLVPFPLLDGGQIVFYAIEGIRGRPLPVVIRDRIQMIGILALVALFLVVTVNDVSRWIGG